MAKGLEHEILTGIAAYKALKPTAQDRYYDQMTEIARRENDDYREKIKNREAAVAAGKPQQTQAGVPPAIAHSGMPGSPMPLPDAPFNPTQTQTRADRTGQTMRFAGGGLAGGLAKGFNDTFRMPSRRPQAIIVDRWGSRDRPSDAGIPGSTDAAQNAALTYGPAPAYRRGGRVRRYQEGGEVAAQYTAEDEAAQEQRRRQDQATGDDIIREMISMRVGEPDVYDPSIELRERAGRDRQAMAAKIPPPPTPPGQPVEYTPVPQSPDPSQQLTERGATDRAELEAKYRTAIPAPPDAGDLDPSAEYTRMGEEEAAIRRQDDTGLHRSNEQFGPPTEAEYEDLASRRRMPRSNIGPPTQVPLPPSEALPDPNSVLPRPEGKKTSTVGRALAPIIRRARAVGGEVLADYPLNPQKPYGTGDPANAYPDYNEDPELYQQIIRQREIDRLRVGPTEAVSPEKEAERNAEIERIRREGDRPVPVPGTPAYQHPYTGLRNEPAVPTGPQAPAVRTNTPVAAAAAQPAAPSQPAAPAAGQPAATGAKPRVGDTQTGEDGRRLFWNGKAWVPLSQTEQYGPPEQFGPPDPTNEQLAMQPPTTPLPSRHTPETYGPAWSRNGPPSNGTNTAGGAPNQAAPPPGAATANTPTRAEKPETRVRAFNPDIDRRDPTTGATLPAQLDAQGRPVAPSGPGSLGSATGYSNGDIAQTLNGAATQVRPGVDGGAPPIGHNAADRLIFHQYTQTHSQNGKFSPGEAMLIGMVSDYKTLLKQGRIEQANKMAYALLQAANLEAASFGMQARDQLARGDNKGAAQSVVNGLNYIADGVSQRISADGQFLESYDPRTGAVTARTPMDGRLILAGIMGLSDGTLFWKTLQASAAMLRKPDTGAEGRALANDLRRRQIALADQRLAKGNAPRGGGGGGTDAYSRAQAALRRFQGEPNPPPQQGGGGGGGTDDTLAMINFDVRDPDDSGGGGG